MQAVLELAGTKDASLLAGMKPLVQAWVGQMLSADSLVVQGLAAAASARLQEGLQGLALLAELARLPDLQGIFPADTRAALPDRSADLTRL